MAKKLSTNQLAERFIKRHRLDPKGTSGSYAAFGFLAGYRAAQRRIKPEVRYVTRYVGGSVGLHGTP